MVAVPPTMGHLIGPYGPCREAPPSVPLEVKGATADKLVSHTRTWAYRHSVGGLKRVVGLPGEQVVVVDTTWPLTARSGN